MVPFSNTDCTKLEKQTTPALDNDLARVRIELANSWPHPQQPHKQLASKGTSEARQSYEQRGEHSTHIHEEAMQIFVKTLTVSGTPAPRPPPGRRSGQTTDNEMSTGTPRNPCG